MIAPEGTRIAGYLARARAALDELEARSLRRDVREAVPALAVDFSSNDYLGLARDPRVVSAFREARRAGSGGARLLGGAHPEHARLERELAEFAGRERALLFSSGYLAALGGIGTLARLVTRAVSDASVHACLIDALRLTRLPRSIAPHGGLADSLGANRTDDAATLAVTESIFGMDGDACDLAALVATLGPDDVAFVDEAHAFGIAGPRGAGLSAAFADERVVVFGTLSKALGAAGGFIAGPHDVVELAQSVARGFVFDTAPPPAVAAAASAALAIVRGDDGDRLRARLHANVARLRALLGAAIGRDALRAPGGFDAHENAAVVPIVVGDARAALELGAELERRGFFAPAVRPPTVPDGSSRLRVTVRADHTPDDLDRFAAAVAAAFERARPRA